MKNLKNGGGAINGAHLIVPCLSGWQTESNFKEKISVNGSDVENACFKI